LLADGGIFGEAKGIIVLATTRRIRGCLGFGFYRCLPTVATCTTDSSEVAAKLRQWRACPTQARYEVYGFTVKLIEKKREEEGAPKYSSHGELDLWRG
jgi:hypothetical protein